MPSAPAEPGGEERPVRRAWPSAPDVQVLQTTDRGRTTSLAWCPGWCRKSTCESCENEVAAHQGHECRDGTGSRSHIAASALVMVGQGVSYMEAADRVRARNSRGRFEHGAQLVANWVEVLGPVVVATSDLRPSGTRSSGLRPSCSTRRGSWRAGVPGTGRLRVPTRCDQGAPVVVAGHRSRRPASLAGLHGQVAGPPRHGRLR